MFRDMHWRSTDRTILVAVAGFLNCVSGVFSQDQPAVAKAVKSVALPSLSMRVKVAELDKLSPSQRQKYLDELTKVLDLGATPKKGALADAEKSWAAAKKVCEADSRLAFAYGLVLTKQAKLELAAEQFSNAKKLSRGTLIAADLELIRGQIARQKFDEAAAAIKDLAESLGEPREKEIDPKNEQATAHWLGRIAGFLQHAAGSSLNFEGLDVQVREALPARLLQDFNTGLTVAQSLHDTLAAEFQSLLEKDRERQEEQERKAKASADADRTEAKSQKAEVGKTAESVTGQVNQKLNNIDGEIATMRDRYFNLQGEIRRLTAAMKELEVQEKSEEREKDPKTGKTIVYTRTRTRIRNPGLHNQYSQQRADCQAECARLNQNAQVAAAVKNQTITAGNQQVNRLQGEALRLQKEESLAAKRQKSAEKKLDKDSVDRSGKTILLETRIRRLDTYLPVTFAEQRQQLLKSFEE